MYSKKNNKTKKKPAPSNFFVGQFKGEIKKVKALWSKASSHNLKIEQIDTTILRKICTQIPFNQDKLAAIARGDEPEYNYLSSVYMVRII